MKINTGSRLIGSLPKIGIRPTIDGRMGGVRESLAGQTSMLAKSVARLFESEIRHPSGEPVTCVISNIIGGVAEAAESAQLFAREGVGLTVTVTPCWCYGSETMDMNRDIPKAIWGFNGTERPGAVYLAATLAGHTQKGMPAFSVYGREVQDASDSGIPDDVREKLLRFAKAGLAVAEMKGKSYLSIGSVSMGIAGSIVNENFFQKYLGMRNEYVDMSEIIRRMEQGIYDRDEYREALEWTAKYCIESADTNPEDKRRSRQQKDSDWEKVVKMTLIIRDLMIGNKKLADIGFGEESLGHNAIAAGFQGQRQWTDFMPNGDFSEAILNSSFDWNGIRQAYVLATENDSLNGAAMLFGHLLTDRAQIFSDVRTYWSGDSVKRVTGMELSGIAKDGFIHLLNSGSTTLDGTGRQSSDGKPVMKPFWDITDSEAEKCLAATRFEPADTSYFRGGGYSSCFVSKGGMPVTMSRLNLVDGLGPYLQLAEGYTVELPEKIHRILDQRTNPTWPTTWFVPRTTGTGNFRDVYSVMANWGANHGAISYGHIGKDLITLASMLRIPVSMHNIEEKDIFRPSAWPAFGMDPEGADYRACRNFGLLYK